MLGRAGADLDSLDNEDSTALALAAEQGKAAVVQASAQVRAAPPCGALPQRGMHEISSRPQALGNPLSPSTLALCLQALVKADASLARLSPEELRHVVRLLGRACKVSRLPQLASMAAAAARMNYRAGRYAGGRGKCVASSQQPEPVTAQLSGAHPTSLDVQEAEQ